MYDYLIVGAGLYGAHIFHTNNTKVWNYITQFAIFNRFTNSPVANYKGELYSAMAKAKQETVATFGEVLHSANIFYSQNKYARQSADDLLSGNETLYPGWFLARYTSEASSNHEKTMMKRIAEGATRIFLACGTTDFRNRGISYSGIFKSDVKKVLKKVSYTIERKH